MATTKSIIDNGHWSYETLLCYQKSVVIFDLTYHFCNRFIEKRDRTYDQMIQAARSGKQNIVEGYTDASTSTRRTPPSSIRIMAMEHTPTMLVL